MSDKIINCEFEFKCPISWYSLQILETPDVRFCNNCQKNVYSPNSREQFEKLAKEGKCVYVAGIIGKPAEHISIKPEGLGLSWFVLISFLVVFLISFLVVLLLGIWWFGL